MLKLGIRLVYIMTAERTKVKHDVLHGYANVYRMEMKTV